MRAKTTQSTEGSIPITTPRPATPPQTAAASITIEIQTPTLVITISESIVHREQARLPVQNRNFACFSRWHGTSIEFSHSSTTNILSPSPVDDSLLSNIIG